jgi:hypothetical protein
MKVNYAVSSPYFATKQLSWRIDSYVDRPIPADKTDKLLTLEPKYNLRPDLLSQDQYGTPAYYWVFMQRNIDLIRDPIFDMKTGMTIKIPTAQRLKALGL